MLRVPHVAMVNLLAGRLIVPELLQQDCTPAKLAAIVRQLLTNPAAADMQRAAFRGVMAALAPPHGLPSAAAAAAVLELLADPQTRP